MNDWRRLPRRLACIILTAICCLLVTGCWDSVELDRLAFTASTGIDYKDGKWVISYQVVVPSAISPAAVGGQGRIPFAVYTTSGRTIRDALWRTRYESSRGLYLGHTRTLIIGESALKHGVSQLMDLYLRNLDTRETVSVLATSGEARQILGQLMQFEVLPGEGLEDMIAGEANEESVLPYVTIHTLGMSLLGTSRSGVVPEVIISGSSPLTKLEEMNQSILPSQLKLGRLEVLHHDKHAGWLSQKEAFGLGFMRNEIKATTIAFSCTSGGRKPNSTFRLLRNKTKLSVSKADGRFNVKVLVKVEGDLRETDCPLDFNEPNAEREMEKQLEKDISEQILNSWTAIKKLKTDVVGVSDLIHRKYPKEWRAMKSDWEREFVRIDIHPKVEVKINHTGLTLKSYKKQAEEE
ncbi:Ger(x)C family spore germination protein [Paenibacillus xanthanilyticus]|uniref:Ger(X)C family spore germination protein n=1 Tax=Paenibacillus xanthanilyticus TaxID=1783531 RepID=A0ABV8K6K8_9BACL